MTESKSEGIHEKADASPLRKPVNTLAIVPQAKRLSSLFRKTYNVMLYIAQGQGIDHEIHRAPLTEVLAGIDYDSKDTAVVKRHFREMATTAVEWQSPTKGEGAAWTVSGLIAHAQIYIERGQSWLEWSYSVKLRQELLEPGVFARLSIGIISQLRSHAGIALYEICSRYRDVGRTARQPWSWWRPVLSGKPETEKQKQLEYRFFKRDVLKTAVAEVNSITDIEVELLEFKEGRFISDLQFIVKKKAQIPLPLQNPPRAVDLSLVTRARTLGVDEDKAEALLFEYGDDVLRSALDGLERRVASSFPEPLRDHYRYLKSMMPGEAAKAVKKAEEATKKAVPSAVGNQDRQDRWNEEWLRRRRKQVIDSIAALSSAEQQELSRSLLDNMTTRDVHPSIRKRLETKGWMHPLVVDEMVRYYAVSAIGESWNKPSSEQILEIASEVGDNGI